MNPWNKARIAKQYHFSASHQLTQFGENHPCARLHGHNYVVEAEVRGEVSPVSGVIVDFYFIDKSVKPIIDSLDHRHLNDFIEIPTAENLAQYIMDQVPTKFLFSVKVWETPKAWAQVINADGLWGHHDKID